MNLHAKAKLALLKRTAPRPIRWLVDSIVSDSESTEMHLRHRIQELEREMWYYRDKLEEMVLSGQEEEKH